jgi:hypothetical protein
VLTLLLAYQSSTLWRLLPLYLFDGIARLIEDGWLLMKEPSWMPERAMQVAGRYGLVLRGLRWLFANRTAIRQRRRALQSQRVAPDDEILPLLSGKIFDDVVPTRAHTVANALSVRYCAAVGMPVAEMLDSEQAPAHPERDTTPFGGPD